MVQIKELVNALGLCLERKVKLAECRRQGKGDIEYFSFGYVQDLALAEATLERTFDAYIDQRIEARLAAAVPNERASTL